MPAETGPERPAPAREADPVRNKAIVDRIPAGRWAEPDDVVDGGWMGR